MPDAHRFKQFGSDGLLKGEGIGQKLYGDGLLKLVWCLGTGLGGNKRGQT